MARKFQPITDSILRTDDALGSVHDDWNNYLTKRCKYAEARERHETLTRKPIATVTDEELIQARHAEQRACEEYMASIGTFKKSYFHFKATLRMLIQNKQL